MDFDDDYAPEYRPLMSNLKKIREKAGLTQIALAEKVGTGQPQILRLENGTRKLTKEWAERLAPHLDVTPEQLLFGDAVSKGMPVVGMVQAGQFRDISILDQSFERPVISVSRDHRFPDADQYALEVLGDSMDELFPDGSYVTCVAWADTGLELRAGMIVHVERSFGSLVETTLKEISGSRPNWFLKPRSRNPKHKIITFDPHDGHEVTVKGLVTGKWEPVQF